MMARGRQDHGSRQALALLQGAGPPAQGAFPKPPPLRSGPFLVQLWIQGFQCSDLKSEVWKFEVVGEGNLLKPALPSVSRRRCCCF